MPEPQYYKGIFWWIDGVLLCRKVRCDEAGAPLEPAEFTSKSGVNFNHKAEWVKLPRRVTCGRPYNAYPRGRVEIKNGRAVIYLHPSLNREDVLSRIYAEFLPVGFPKIMKKSDGSAHYRALLDADAD